MYKNAQYTKKYTIYTVYTIYMHICVFISIHKNVLYIFLSRQQTAILTILTFCIELRHLNLGSCVRVRINTHTNIDTHTEIQVKHSLLNTTCRGSLLLYQLVQKMAETSAVYCDCAANIKMVACKVDEARVIEAKRSQYYICLYLRSLYNTVKT